MTDYREKAHRIIAAESLAAYRAANIRNGRAYKRHHPYTVPAIVDALVKALGQNDEYEIKRLYLIHDTGALSLI